MRGGDDQVLDVPIEPPTLAMERAVDALPAIAIDDIRAKWHAARDALVASYEAKCDDLRRETLRTSEALQATAERGIHSPRNIIGQEGIGWDMAMEYVETRLRAVGVCADRVHLNVCVMPAGHGPDVMHDNAQGSRWGHG